MYEDAQKSPVQLRQPASWRTCLAGLCLLIHALSVIAEEDTSPLLIERPWDFGIALGYGELSNPFIGSDDIPLYLSLDVAWYGERFFFDNGNLGFTLLDRPNQGLSLITNYSSDRLYHSFFNTLGGRVGDVAGNVLVNPTIDPGDINVSPPPPSSIRILKIPDRDFAINAGVEYLLAGDWGQLQTSLTHDVTSTHDGIEAAIELSRSWQFGKLGLNAALGGVWKDRNLVDYYYGLEASENPSLNIAYTGRSAFNLTGTLGLSYRLTRHMSLVSLYSHEELGSGITDSPLIDAGHSRSVFAGVFYRF